MYNLKVKAFCSFTFSFLKDFDFGLGYNFHIIFERIKREIKQLLAKHVTADLTVTLNVELQGHQFSMHKQDKALENIFYFEKFPFFGVFCRVKPL